jgi:hypothetical protein
MTKVKIIGEGGSENVKYIIVKKEENFFQWLELFLGQKIEEKRLRFRNIKDSKDTHECHFTKERWRIDIFYGDKKIYLVYFANSENEKIMRKKMDKFADFSEYCGD